MRASLILAVLAMACAIGQGTAWAKSDSPAASAPASEVVDGQVTKIDADRGRVTIHSADGTAHEFEASKDTLQGLKVGDRIEAKQRPASD